MAKIRFFQIIFHLTHTWNVNVSVIVWISPKYSEGSVAGMINDGIKFLFNTYQMWCTTLLPITCSLIIKMDSSYYTTFINFSMKYLVMCKVFTDAGGIK